MKFSWKIILLLFSISYSAQASLKLGFILSDFTYRETHQGQFIMQDKSYLQGVKARFDYEKTNLGITLDGTYQWGTMAYTSEKSGDMTGHFNTILDTRASIHYSWHYPSWSLQPFLGYGYHKLIDDSTNMYTSTGHVGYLRTQRYRYLPIGFNIKNIKVSSELTIGIHLEYDYFLHGNNTTDMSSIPNHGVRNYVQNKGYGYRASLMFDYQQLRIEPFFKYWDIDESDVKERYVVYNNQTYLERSWEPNNKTTEFGIVFSYIIF